MATLEDGDEQVLALLPAGPPLGKVLGFGDVAKVARDQRLLVLTRRSFLELTTNGGVLLVGNVMAVEVPLARIHDGLRMNVQRRMGSKVRMLAVDHLVGSNVETLGYEVAATDETLAQFVERANLQVDAVRARIAQDQERRVREQAEQAAAAVAQQIAVASPKSTADEIERLAALLDRGVLTPEEFAGAKARALDNARAVIPSAGSQPRVATWACAHCGYTKNPEGRQRCAQCRRDSF